MFLFHINSKRGFLFFYFLLLIFGNKMYAQQHFSLDKDVIYIVTRSTQSKEGLVASSFNISDKIISHIGIGYVENNKLMIYNVSNYKSDSRGSFLQKETLVDFISEKGIEYYSVWKHKPDKKTLDEFRVLINKRSSAVIKFDKNFNLDNNDLYCSEFVFNLLKDLKITSFTPIKKELGVVYSVALGRKILEYIPVDFFLSESIFNLLYEEHIKNN